ncbi:MAG: AIR synthase-related protein, partial [Eggerthella lenta]
IYVKPVRAVLEACEGAVHALAHITGGGISENLDRALPKSCAAEVDLGTWPVPAIASFVCDAAHLDEAEALKTFNMGLGMVLIVDAARADEVEAALTQAGETTYRVGRIVAGEGEVRYANDGKLYGFGAEA